jgi:hypothetical protein
LDEKTDDFNRRFFVPQIEGSKTGLELPSIPPNLSASPIGLLKGRLIGLAVSRTAIGCSSDPRPSIR